MLWADDSTNNGKGPPVLGSGVGGSCRLSNACFRILSSTRAIGKWSCVNGPLPRVVSQIPPATRKNAASIRTAPARTRRDERRSTKKKKKEKTTNLVRGTKGFDNRAEPERRKLRMQQPLESAALLSRPFRRFGGVPSQRPLAATSQHTQVRPRPARCVTLAVRARKREQGSKKTGDEQMKSARQIGRPFLDMIVNTEQMAAASQQRFGFATQPNPRNCNPQRPLGEITKRQNPLTKKGNTP
ncbi:hypothetical protein B0I37DRAFT_237045 [Chaetomium sp. MPI-CAGE-AT-0009]|nr:hypothetical protein B0I37DRAFT_237045 [Chaetomium sp. MPI-CAGE-AT-0009]